MQFVTPSKKVGPNLKLYYERFLSEFNENGKSCLAKKIIEIIEVEVDAKICFGQSINSIKNLS